MRSDNLRPLTGLGALDPELRAQLDAFAIAPPPFDLDAPPPKEAVILQWNDPRDVIDRTRAYSKAYHAAHPRKPKLIAPPAPTISPAAEPEPEPAPQDPHLHLAKQLIAFAGSLRDSDIAKAARVPVETIAQLRREVGP